MSEIDVPKCFMLCSCDGFEIVKVNIRTRVLECFVQGRDLHDGV